MNEQIKELWTSVCQNEMPELDETCMTLSRQRKFAELIIEEAAKAPLCDSDGVVGKYSDSDRYYFETLMKKQLGLK
jgi:hypothetical protein